MKKRDNWFLIIFLWLIIFAVIGLAVWGFISVLKADIPTWLKFAILKG